MALVNDPLFLVVAGATLNYAPCTRRAWRIKTYLLAARRLRAEGCISRLHLSSFPVPVGILKRPPLIPESAESLIRKRDDRRSMSVTADRRRDRKITIDSPNFIGFSLSLPFFFFLP